MKIGVDARLLSRPVMGIGRYTFEMCKALSKLEDVTLNLYSPSSFRTDVIFKNQKVNFRSMNLSNGVLRQIWTESCLPFWAMKDNVDVFWGPAHRLPHFLPKNMPKVVTIHDLVWKYAGDTMRPASRLLERYQMPYSVSTADEIVADSQATANAVSEEFDIDMDILNIVSLGVTLSENTLSPESLFDLGIKGSYFLFVGTLEPRKNLSNLLIAYSDLEDNVKATTQLVIAGGKGWGGVNISDKVKELNLENNVCILGYVNDLILATLYANAEFIAMPSLYEGFGLPLVEAMAHGTPVLSANNSSMPEVVGDAGILVDALDVASITNGLNQLITDKELRCKLAANSKDNIKKFNWDKSAQQLMNVFEKAINHKKTDLL